MKTVDQIKPNYAPVYCALYPDLAKIFHKHGYTLAVHGSLARDFDLIAVPWGYLYSKPEHVIQDISNQFAIKQVGEPEQFRLGASTLYKMFELYVDQESK